jgi:RHS repeat-associated protein
LPGLTLPQQEIDNNYPAVATNVGSGPTFRTYTLDNSGNWTGVTTSAGAVAYSVDGLSRLTTIGSQSVSTDTADNLLGLSNDPNDLSHFTFDNLTGFLLSQSNGAASGAYAYDAMGRRALETGNGSPVAFLWDGATLVAHGDPNALTIDIPSDDIDGHIASVEQNGTGKARFYHQGPDQSVLAVTDEKGLVEGYSYSAFGETSVWSPSGTALADSLFGNRFRFQGHLYDPQTGTYSMRARQYQPRWGRFLSPDPLSFLAAPSAYSFTGSRPLTARDPSGLGDCDVGVCSDDTTDFGNDGSLSFGTGGGVTTGGIPTVNFSKNSIVYTQHAYTVPLNPSVTKGAKTRGTPGAVGQHYDEYKDVSAGELRDAQFFACSGAHISGLHCVFGVKLPSGESGDFLVPDGATATGSNREWSTGEKIMNVLLPGVRLDDDEKRSVEGILLLTSVLPVAQLGKLAELFEGEFVAAAETLEADLTQGARDLGRAAGFRDLAAFRERFGLTGNDGTTFARLDISDQTLYGISAHGQAYEHMANITYQFLRHAEGDVFGQALRLRLGGGSATLWSDLPLCRFCQNSMAGFARHLHLDRLIVHDPLGTFIIRP